MASRNAVVEQALRIVDDLTKRVEGKSSFSMTDQELAAAAVLVLHLRSPRAVGSPFGPDAADLWAARFSVKEPAPSVTDSGAAPASAAVARRCDGCGGSIPLAARADARFCSNACRQRAYRVRTGHRGGQHLCPAGQQVGPNRKEHPCQ